MVRMVDRILILSTGMTSNTCCVVSKSLICYEKPVLIDDEE